MNAVMLHPSKSEDGEITDVTWREGILHLVSVGWKVLFALGPPAHYGIKCPCFKESYLKGWPCFFAALACIGAVTAVVGQVATLMGCVMGVKPGITAITFVAIGTSLPDTFASKKAAKGARYADSAVGNITGSNSVNVFLGLGLPWVIAIIYELYVKDEKDSFGVYRYPARGLDLSVLLFLVCSLIGLATLCIRRCVVKGELGGSKVGRISSSALFVFLWVLYVAVCSLYQLDVIDFSLTTPPAWYTCTKTPTDAICTEYCKSKPTDPVCPPSE